MKSGGMARIFSSCLIHWSRIDAFPPSKTTKTEVIKESAATMYVLLNTKPGEFHIINLHKVMGCERYISYNNNLLWVIVRILQFKDPLRRSQTDQREEVSPFIYHNQLTGEDMNKVLWIWLIQLRSFSEELTHLSFKSKYSPSTWAS